MKTTTMLAMVAVVGLGCWVAVSGLRAEAAGMTPDEIQRLADAAAETRTAELDQAVARLDRRVDGLRSINWDLESRIAELGERLDRRASATAAPVRSEQVEDASSGDDAADSVTARRAELEALRGKVMGASGTADELARFLQLAKSDGLVDGLISELEAGTKGRPNDLDNRMKLADAYITKLMTVPGGPEQGVWGMKAESQWQAVLKLDDEHWDARHGLAYSWSMWPEFLGKTGPAIEQYERLVEVQEQGASEERHADVYVELSRLYERRGDTGNARAILERGSERHPDAESLAEALRQAPGAKGQE